MTEKANDRALSEGRMTSDEQHAKVSAMIERRTAEFQELFDACIAQLARDNPTADQVRIAELERRVVELIRDLTASGVLPGEPDH